MQHLLTVFNQEMLYFLLPLINFHRITNYIRRLVSRQQPASENSVRQAGDYTRCVVCDQWPVLPHAVGCCHVFCYYCVTVCIRLCSH